MVTCNGDTSTDPSTTFTNPGGARYNIGECWCEFPELAEKIVQFTAEGLQDLDKITRRVASGAQGERHVELVGYSWWCWRGGQGG